MHLSADTEHLCLFTRTLSEHCLSERESTLNVVLADLKSSQRCKRAEDLGSPFYFDQNSI